MDQVHSGYDKKRFQTITDEFDCSICTEIAITPKQCENCLKVYCTQCIDDWLKKGEYVNSIQFKFHCFQSFQIYFRQCPNRCDKKFKIGKFKDKMMEKHYYSLKLKCNYCPDFFVMTDIESHERVCQYPKCQNFVNCGSRVSGTSSLPQLTKMQICSPECQFFLNILNYQGNFRSLYSEINNFITKQYPNIDGPNNSTPSLQKRPSNMTPNLPILSNPAQSIQLSWDPQASGSNISIKNSNEIFLNEAGYIFKSCLTKESFSSGVHYWEVTANEQTQNEMKIGIMTKKDFDYNTAFCDTTAGFAYYGIGQLRSGNNANGPAYGYKVKNKGTVGILLDMNQGQLSFGMNGKTFGVAFNDSRLKKGPIYPAVALLHCAGCTINYKAVPYNFNAN